MQTSFRLRPRTTIMTADQDQDAHVGPCSQHGMSSHTRVPSNLSSSRTADTRMDDYEEDEPYDCTPKTHRSYSIDLATVPLVTPTSSDDSLSFEWNERKRKLKLSPRSKPRGAEHPLHPNSTASKFPRLIDTRDGTVSIASLTGSLSSTSSSTLSRRFQSVLDRPIVHWTTLNTVLGTVHPEWTAYQRGRMIHHLLHFLELKVGMAEYIPSGLLWPSPAVNQAWRALVLETTLYETITHAIQDFHDKPHAMIHYSSFSPKDVEGKLRRTQSLFQVYFKETMPSSVAEEEVPVASFSPPPSRFVFPSSRVPRCDSHVFEFSSPSLQQQQQQQQQHIPGPKALSRETSKSTAVETQSMSSNASVESLMGLDYLGE